MMTKYALTTIANLPQAGGQAASLPAEVGKPKQDEIVMYHAKADGDGWDVSVTLASGIRVSVGRATKFDPAWAQATVQMKAPYFDDLYLAQAANPWIGTSWASVTNATLAYPPIDLGEIGGTGA